ncbi:MAG TPA: hypothetical protein VL172_10810, partial [Kofleriaceae bacterium]|nr:hypothetical protein [Kofleriaceae bacterium]
MTPTNLCKLLPILLLPVGACMGDDTDIDTAEPTALFDDVHPGPGTQVALSPDLAVLPGASVDAPIEPPVPDGNPAPAGDADMAWNGSQWLAVWTDLRGGDADIRAAVVSADGEVDPPAGVLLIGGAGDQHDPKVAWNGGRYLVVYAETRDDATQVRAARVTADAVVLDPDGFAAGAQMLASDIHIACNGTSFYAVWQGDCAMEACPGTIRGQYISSAGAAGPVATLAYKAALPQIAWNGNDYLVVWNDLGGVDVDISARIVHADATPGATTSISARAGDQELPVVAASGDRFLVAWRE